MVGYNIIQCMVYGATVRDVGRIPKDTKRFCSKKNISSLSVSGIDRPTGIVQKMTDTAYNTNNYTRKYVVKHIKQSFYVFHSLN